MKKINKKSTNKKKSIQYVTRISRKNHRSLSINLDESRTVDDMIKLFKDLKKDLGGNAVVTMDAGYNNVDMHVFEVHAMKL